MLSDEEIRKQANELPDEDRQRIFGQYAINAIIAIGDQFDLSSSEQLDTIAGIMAESILGALPKNRLRAEIQQRLAVPEGAAVELVDAIQKALTTKQPTLPQKAEPVHASIEEYLPPIKLTSRPTQQQTGKQLDAATAAPKTVSLPKKTVTPIKKMERPTIPLPEDALLKSSEKEQVTSVPKNVASAKKTDTYREVIKKSDLPKELQPVPERPKEHRENLGPLIDGNIIDLRE